MITKQKAFNKSLVDENTQVIFLDEAHSKLMDPDDRKILTQGGLTAHDRKYKTSSLAVIRCPMCITCQNDMDFGAEHNVAMNVRLKKFVFKTLRSCSRSASVVMVQCNGLYCTGVWNRTNSRRRAPPSMPGTSSQPDEFDEKERERIKSI